MTALVHLRNLCFLFFIIGYTKCAENSSLECHEEKEFQCQEKCIPTHWRCDYDRDCETGEDEQDCEILKCGPEHVLCESHDQCINANWWCDGEADCEDDSDEVDCANVTCPAVTVPCQSGVKKCVLKRMLCDGQKDCHDASDETGCGVTCPPDRVMCRGGPVTCIKPIWICDGEPDCPSGTDEANCSPTCSSEEYQCKDGKCIKNSWLCDMDQDCEGGEDEMNCRPVKCATTEYMCADNSCISKDWVCDGEGDCEDDSDEIRCPNTTESMSNATSRTLHKDKHSGLITTESISNVTSRPLHKDKYSESLVFTVTPTDVTVRVGSTAKLSCAATGNPEPTISWLKDGKTNFPAAMDRRMHVLPSGRDFFIVDIRVEDAGTYSCLATNTEDVVIIVNGTLTVIPVTSQSKSTSDLGTTNIEITSTEDTNSSKRRTTSSSGQTKFQRTTQTNDVEQTTSMEETTLLRHATNREERIYIEQIHSMKSTTERETLLELQTSRPEKSTSEETTSRPQTTTSEETTSRPETSTSEETTSRRKYRKQTPPIRRVPLGRQTTSTEQTTTNRIKLSGGFTVIDAIGESTCRPGMFSCGDGKCIPDRWVCDRQEDCLNHRDELECGEITCGPKFVQCKSGQCIPTAWRCDGQTDCLDGTDEEGCPNYAAATTVTSTTVARRRGKRPKVTTAPSTTVAQTTTATSSKWTTTFSPFFFDNEEEIISQSHNTKLESSANSKQQNSVNSKFDNAVNPKLDTSVSSRPGSAVPATNTVEDGHLLVLSRMELQIIDLHTNDVEVVRLAPEDSRAEPVGLEVDVRRRKVYWTDRTYTNINSATLTDMYELEDKEQVFQKGIQRSEGLALDWVHQNLYWSDSSAKTITVASLVTKQQKTLIATGLETVRGVAVDPKNGLLFWTSYGEHPKIEMCGTDGSHRQIVHDTGLEAPSDIAIDYKGNSLYWCDSDSQEVGVCDLKRGRCQVLFKSTTPLTLFSIDIYKKHLYWSDLAFGKVQRMNRKMGKYVRTIQTDMVNPRGVAVFHKFRQPYSPNRCGKNNGGCEICLPSPRGGNSTDDFICACPDNQFLQYDGRTCDKKDPAKPSPCFHGYVLKDNRCVDVDECESEVGSCSQMCVNAPGSFTCSCQSGYILVNNTRCVARGKGSLIVLDFSNFKRINLKTFEFETLSVPQVFPVGLPIALDVDVRRDVIIWADLHRDTINMAEISGSRLLSPSVLVKDEGSVVGLAYDWVHRNLYYTKDEDKAEAIRVVAVDNKDVKTLLKEDLGKPRAIVADPERGTIYWTNWMPPATIEKCGMDGTHRQTIVNTDIHWPNGLTIDYANKRLYWCDAYLDSVTSSDLDGGDVRVIVDKSDFAQEHMYALTNFEDYVYWTDWNSETVRQMNKATGERIFHLINAVKPHDIKVFHQARQPNAPNRCRKNRRGCRICLPTPDGGYKCACADDQVLQEDSKTCKKGVQMYATCSPGFISVNGSCVDMDECERSVCSHTCVNTPGSFRCECPDTQVLINDTQCVQREPVSAVLLVADTNVLKKADLGTGEVESLSLGGHSQARSTALDVDVRNRLIYWTDYLKTGIYTARLDKDFKLTERRTLNVTKIRDPQGLALDWANNNLYWSDLSANTLLVVSLTTGVQKTLLDTELDYIRGIAVDPRHGWLYWANWGMKPRISRCGMDGSRREVLLHRGLDTPNDVTIDFSTNRLYWVDGWATKIGSCDLNGKDCRVVWQTKARLMLFSIDVFKNSIYWTEWKKPKVRRFNLTSSTPAEVVVEDATQPAGVVVYHPDRQPYARGRCNHAYKNGCQLCFPTPPGSGQDYKCACPDGQYLQSDERSCGDTDPSWPQCRSGYRIINGTCHDINECEEQLDFCQQLCVNTNGSYICQCRVGFDLVQGSCVQSRDAFLVLIEHVAFRRFNLTTFDSQLMKTENTFNIHRPVSLDFDVENSLMFWSDLSTGSINVATVEGLLLKDARAIVKKGALTVHGLAYDWIHGILFWVDAEPESEVIMARSLKTRSTRTLVNENIGKPRAIVVHPQKRWIFWTNWARSASIERCGMDGTQRSVIVNQDIKWPNGITLDYDSERVYWTDAGTETLSSCRLDGSDRRVLIHKPSQPKEHFFSTTQYADHIFWTEWLSRSLRVADKRTGGDITTYHLKRTPMDVKIFHPSRQKPGKNACGDNNGGCTHLCLPSPMTSSGSREFQCQCPDDMLLSRDDKSCLTRRHLKRQKNNRN